MGKKRIYELAKELHITNKKLVDTANQNGLHVKNHMSTLSQQEENKLRNVLKPKSHNNATHQSSNNHHKNSENNNNRNNNNGGRFGGSLKRNNHHNHGNGNNRRYGKKRRRRFNKYATNQRIKPSHNHKQTTRRKERPLPKTLVYEVGMNCQDLGKILHRSPSELVKKLFMLGIMANQNKSLDKDTIELLAASYNINAKEKKHEDLSDIDKIFQKEEKNTKYEEPRAPVVTIMGHVDHGKTTLLDHLRHSHITSGEAGGITQAIGAYQLKHNGKMITFLDTPGHAAFTEMRARGADITDITILVVAADDGVMPQTVEAIDHAKAAKTPIVVAINKIDKEGANPQHVAQQLTQYGLIPEDWGGNTMFVNISAKVGTNVDKLLDMVILQAEVMELKANPKQHAAGSVIEARLDRGQGPVATVLIQQGTMHVGDPIVVGDTYGRVRTMHDEFRHAVKTAKPSTPVEITGLNDVPEAGDRFVVFDDEKSARSVGEKRAEESQMEERKKTNTVTLDNLFDSLKESEKKEVDIIIKADVQGSVEALASSLKKIEVKGVKVNIIHSAVGAISESDVALAEASHAIIIGFNVTPTPSARSQAKNSNVDIRLHRIIYDAINEVKSAMKGKLAPVYKPEITGDVEVRQLYKASKVGTIAGGMVTNGYIKSDSKIHLIRDNKIIYDGELASLKRYKDDVNEVKQGYELGLTIQDYNDIKVGDVIEAYVMKAVPVK
ncbi:translation initiation factor IF-2 [Philodulcilactobacillus myokoensis]|uniref:Translation initiation factor IF-2 n=1 Tax=Philodulcilactobacillus myokoensis TaxID=2929573 RepID=A0A9W6ESY4_9LACO|nr:translation initiation factor IF-2 [Philodulcilactobacillus myokoensis]GLB46942.1 translation initiation factor IF-2 [Philodulcilactobacillus myokoensis]